MKTGIAIFRLSPLIISVLYAMLALSMNENLPLMIVGALIFVTAIQILRGLTEDVTIVEAVILLIGSISLILSPAPVLASWYTPGVCTDNQLTYEVSLVGFMYFSTALWAYLWSKVVFPSNAQALTRSERKLMAGTPLWVPGLATMLSGVSAYVIIDQGACVPDTAHMLVLPLVSLSALGVAVFFGSASHRRRVFMRKHGFLLS